MFGHLVFAKNMSIVACSVNSFRKNESDLFLRLGKTQAKWNKGETGVIGNIHNNMYLNKKPK